MNADEIDYWRSLNGSNSQSSDFHVTNTFASDVEELSRLSARADINGWHDCKYVFRLRGGLIEIKMEGRISQGKLESSIASINDLVRQRDGLTKRRITEMTSIMEQRDLQA